LGWSKNSKFEEIFQTIKPSHMSRYHSFYDTVDQIIHYGIEKGILHLNTGGAPFNGTHLTLDDRPVINFGSCSYLGLEFDPRLKQGAKEAIDKYGTQFAASRAYVSLGLYGQLQSLLEEIFEAPCVITPTTTLGHIANIPVLVQQEDAVIMDQQVHNSVQIAVELVKAKGTHIELLRHNRMDLLEARIRELRDKYKKIWYMADGVYSMFGDCIPIDTIYHLLNKYAELHLYVDDAHGMSIHGKNGRGFVLSQHAIHYKMVMATSLNKAFASGGGVVVYGDKALARKVGNVGGPLLSSGPMQPSALGAAIAAAKIHLSDEITHLQGQLKDNLLFTTMLLKQHGLPLISVSGAAIFFVGVSLPKLGHNLVRRMLDKGYYLNLGVFPTVPMRQTGIRFTITRLHTFSEIANMISTLAAEFPVAMQEEQITMEAIYKAFRVPAPETAAWNQSVDRVLKQALDLQLFHYTSIQDIPKKEWNQLFEGKGTFDWEGLNLLELSFTENAQPQDNWAFDYVIVRNRQDEIIAATFLTTALWKEDMLSQREVSAVIEQRRETDPVYLTSKVICSGSLLTEGEHLFLNKDAALWKDALQLLIEKIYFLQEYRQANHIVLRDFKMMDTDFDNLLVDNGFFKVTMPDTHIISNLQWENPAAYYNGLSANGKNHLRKKVLRHSDQFKVEVIGISDWAEEIDHWYNLYLNVKNNNLELNTFALPKKLFYQLAKNEHWEMLQLTVRDASPDTTDKPCCVVFSYRTKEAYVPMIIGLDYRYNQQYAVYRQALYQVVLRAKQVHAVSILLGFSAGIEKQKLGAKAIPTFAYMHSKDSFNAAAIETIALSKKQSIPR
jgi:7-keto-8-aminopelargonate synthetase-like enzyme/predicted N-acyltransferase